MSDRSPAERPYQEAAYQFLLEALDRCRRELGREKHVSGGELLGTIQSLARERYGPLAAMVFREWGIQGGGDFGNIVYDLIDQGILFQQDEDSLEDFMGGLSYEAIFEEAYFESDPS